MLEAAHNSGGPWLGRGWLAVVTFYLLLGSLVNQRHWAIAAMQEAGCPKARREPSATIRERRVRRRDRGLAGGALLTTGAPACTGALLLLASAPVVAASLADLPAGRARSAKRWDAHVLITSLRRVRLAREGNQPGGTLATWWAVGAMALLLWALACSASPAALELGDPGWACWRP